MDNDRKPTLNESLAELKGSLTELWQQLQKDIVERFKAAIAEDSVSQPIAEEEVKEHLSSRGKGFYHPGRYEDCERCQLDREIRRQPQQESLCIQQESLCLAYPEKCTFSDCVGDRETTQQQADEVAKSILDQTGAQRVTVKEINTDTVAVADREEQKAECEKSLRDIDKAYDKGSFGQVGDIGKVIVIPKGTIVELYDRSARTTKPVATGRLFDNAQQQIVFNNLDGAVSDYILVITDRIDS